MVDGHGDNASLMVIVKLEMTVKVVIVLVMVLLVMLVVVMVFMDENVSSFSIRFFSQWEAFVDLEKTRRISQERAEGFRRYSIIVYNCLK